MWDQFFIMDGNKYKKPTVIDRVSLFQKILFYHNDLTKKCPKHLPKLEKAFWAFFTKFPHSPTHSPNTNSACFTSTRGGSSLYITGVTMRDSSVELIRPPMSTRASGE